jgi:hypothetical protein
VAGKTVEITGGALLAGLLQDNGARAMVCDVNCFAVGALHHEIDVAPDAFSMVGSELDAVTPCALAALDGATVRGARLRRCEVANNQFVVEGTGGPAGALMARHHIRLGLFGECRRRIQVSDELLGLTSPRPTPNAGHLGSHCLSAACAAHQRVSPARPQITSPKSECNGSEATESGF